MVNFIRPARAIFFYADPDIGGALRRDGQEIGFFSGDVAEREAYGSDMVGCRPEVGYRAIGMAFGKEDIRNGIEPTSSLVETRCSFAIDRELDRSGGRLI
jgi:hypothetical protein